MPHRVQPPGRINRVCGAAGGEGALAVLSNSHTKNSCSVWLPRQNITSPAAAHPEVSWSLMPLTRERRGLCVSVGNSVWKAFGGIYVFWMFRLTLIKQMSHVYAVWLDPKTLIAGEHSERNIIAQSGACNVMHAASSRLRPNALYSHAVLLWVKRLQPLASLQSLSGMSGQVSGLRRNTWCRACLHNLCLGYCKKSALPEMLHQLMRKDHLKQGRHYVGDGVDIVPLRFSQVKRYIHWIPFVHVNVEDRKQARI